MNRDMNIFLVEDDDLDFEILTRSLKKIGSRGALVRAHDGVEALEILKKDVITRALPRPYVIMLDINMPRMNGHEFLDVVRKTKEIQDARVIFFTTSENINDVDRAYKNYASGYVIKPSGQAELRKILESLKAYWAICEDPIPITQSGNDISNT